MGYSELKDGISVSLNWPINGIKVPGFGRKGLEHKVFSFRDTPIAAHGYDDEVAFNTQCSSQWDSLCHVHCQQTAQGYNGVQTSPTELQGDDPEGRLPTLNRWHERGGMVARGGFIDYKRYADENGIKFNPYNDDKITTDDIEKIAKRHWNKHFAVVAGDMIAYEHIPPTNPETGEDGTIAELVLHQYFLALFGMSIGELWDLKELSETCKKLGRYSFLLTSSPLNYPGSIGSPPNALALF